MRGVSERCGNGGGGIAMGCGFGVEWRVAGGQYGYRGVLYWMGVIRFKGSGYLSASGAVKGIVERRAALESGTWEVDSGKFVAIAGYGV